MSDERMSAWIAALIAHDLASPIGATAAAIETLDDEDLDEDFRGEAMTLAQESITRATAMLRFLRAAYGPSAGSTAAIADLAGSALDAMAHKKITVDWPRAELDDPGLAKLAALAAHAAPNIAPRGGVARVRSTIDGLRVEISSEDPLNVAAAEPQDGPKAAPWALMRSIAADHGGVLRHEASESGRFVIIFSRGAE